MSKSYTILYSKYSNEHFLLSSFALFEQDEPSIKRIDKINIYIIFIELFDSTIMSASFVLLLNVQLYAQSNSVGVITIL